MEEKVKGSRCKNCLGRKTFVGLGGLGEVKCAVCKGIGYVEQDEVTGINGPSAPKRAYKKKPKTEDIVVDAQEDEDDDEL